MMLTLPEALFVSRLMHYLPHAPADDLVMQIAAERMLADDRKFVDRLASDPAFRTAATTHALCGFRHLAQLALDQQFAPPRGLL